MDVKYVHIHGIHSNAYILAIIDVVTRYLVEWCLSFSIRHTDVILCLSEILHYFKAKHIIFHINNESQFIAHDLVDFCIKRHNARIYSCDQTRREFIYGKFIFSSGKRIFSML